MVSWSPKRDGDALNVEWVRISISIGGNAVPGTLPSVRGDHSTPHSFHPHGAQHPERVTRGSGEVNEVVRTASRGRGPLYTRSYCAATHRRGRLVGRARLP
jgi:hypothetical protein